jgi:hypothetical protein
VISYDRPRFAEDVEHAVVYRRENEFASHPYVRGFWENAAGHLVSNFSVTTVDYAGHPSLLSHLALVHSPLGRRSVTVGSTDRGKTWTILNEDKNRPSNDVKVPEPGVDGQAGRLTEIGPIDYTDRNVFLSNFHHMYMAEDPLIAEFAARASRAYGPPENQVLFRVSQDAGQTWSRSVMVPNIGFHQLMAVESSLVRPDGRCLIFLRGITRPGDPDRCLVYRSIDDGTLFEFLSFITPERDPLHGGLHNMYPRGLMLPNGRILCTVRVDRHWSGDMWTELYKSDDGGKTWQFLSRVTEFGAPGAPLLLKDGRLVLVYTYRLPEPGMRAIVSEDEGATWGGEIIIRDDAGSWDIGYPRAWEAEPGKIGVIYYYNDKDDPIQVKPQGSLWGAGGVRYIARSLFSID